MRLSSTETGEPADSGAPGSACWCSSCSRSSPRARRRASEPATSAWSRSSGGSRAGRCREGIHLVNPVARVHELDIKTQEIKERASVPSQGGPDHGPRSLGALSPAARTAPRKSSRRSAPTTRDVLLVPNFRSAMRSVTAANTASALYSDAREGIARQILADLQAQVQPRGIVIENVLLRDLQLPETLKHAIEAKQQAQQEAQRMEFVLQREQQEAERKRVEAQGIKDFQNIVTQGISDKLLEWKGIEATIELARSSNAKVVVVGNPKTGSAADLLRGQVAPRRARHRAPEGARPLGVSTCRIGQLDAERRARSSPGLDGVDGAAVQLHEVLGNRQPEPQAPRPPRRRRIGLAEAVEHVRQEISRDALAGVLDQDSDTHSSAVADDTSTRPPGTRELHRVVQQVPENLLDAAAIGVNARQRGARASADRRTPLVSAVGLSDSSVAVERRADVERRDLQPDRARGELVHLEQVFDQLRLHLGIALDDGHRLIGIPARPCPWPACSASRGWHSSASAARGSASPGTRP